MFKFLLQVLAARWVPATLLFYAMMLSGNLCLAQHSGNISGNETWMAADNPHTILGDIIIDAGARLTIEPEVNIIFYGQYKIDVQGEIYAVGAYQHEIIFTADDTQIGWQGIKFENTDPAYNSHLQYCILEYGIKTINIACTTGWVYCGGAIYIKNYSGLIIENCTFLNNQASRGGAVYCLAIYEGIPGTYVANPTIQNNEFYANTALRGGALCCRADNSGIPFPQAEPLILGNYIRDNRAYERGGGIFVDLYAAPNITGNQITHNIITGENCTVSSPCGGGGIYCCNNANAIMTDNLIQYNDASFGFNYGKGGGIYSRLQSVPVIGSKNKINNNHANYGGGIYCEDSDPIISACEINRNMAESNGGGIYCTASSPQITNHTMLMYDTARYGMGGAIACYGLSNIDLTAAHIEGNYAYLEGGGLYIENSLPTISASIIRSNTAGSGGGIALEACNGFIPGPQISNSKIFNNIANSGYGGGIYSSGSNPSVIFNQIEGNSSSYSGGGIFLQDSRTGEEIYLNKILRNEASFDGGGIFIQTPAAPQAIINNLIAMNQAMDGGGIFLFENTGPMLNNNTISRNVALNAGGGIFYSATSLPYHTNTIISLNSPDDMNAPYGTYDHCCVASPPGFVSAAGGDFHLTSGSACVNAGTNAVAPITGVDIDGQGRFNGIIDIGSDEYHTPTLIQIPTNYASIQGGIDAAMDFAIIQVEPGLYNENINFNGKNLTIESLTGPDSTVIKGTGSGSVITFTGGETSSAILRGFTIANGNADKGGGIYISNASPTLENLIIRDNYAGNYGGGIYCGEYSYSEIYGCTIYDNSAGYGGGMCAENSSPALTNCTISDNICGMAGGGIAMTYAAPMVRNTIISFNSPGEGIYCTSSNPILACVDIYGNSGGNWFAEIAAQSGINGNMEVDPLFCDRHNGIFSIDSLSPCAPDNALNQCGELIGAGEVACTTLCGDVNRDTRVNISDAVYIINYIFIGGVPPKPYNSGDCNCDGSVNVSDAVRIINYVFLGGFAPCDTNGDGIPDC